MKRFQLLTLGFVLTIIIVLFASITAFAETKTITAGVYNVGSDLPAGEYEIQCTEASDPYKDYLDLMKLLSQDDESLQALLSLYDNYLDEPTVTVTINGASGENKTDFELEKNAKRTITLEDGFSIEIENGTCILELKNNIASYASSDDTSHKTTSSADEWICSNCGNRATGNFCNNCGTARPTDSDAVSFAAANEDIIGKWLCTSAVYNGVTVDISNYANLSMEINADGTTRLSSIDGEVKGKWTRNGSLFTLYSNGVERNGTIENGKITFSVANNSIIFSREAVASSLEFPSPIMANSEDEFFGTWNLSRAATQGLVLTSLELAAMGITDDARLTISRGEARVDRITEGKYEYEEFSTSFTNGKLQLKSINDNGAVVLLLTSSGELLITSASNGITLQIYFTKEVTEDSELGNISESSEIPSDVLVPTEGSAPTEIPSMEAKQETTEKQFLFMPDRWNLYKAFSISSTSWRIEKWSRWNASTGDFKYEYDVSSFDVNDSSYGFAWTDDSQSAFFITLNDSRNNKLDKQRVGFTVSPDTIADVVSLTFTNDRWAQYRAYVLSPSTIKIERWGRWNANTDDFEYYYDIGVIDTNSITNEFSWIDDAHSAFSVVIDDEQNANWKRNAEKIGFSINPETLPNIVRYNYHHDKWKLYKAYAITPNYLKVELWGRWNYNTDKFEHYYDIGLIQIDDPTNDFLWSSSNFNEFSVSIIDHNNDDLDHQTKVSFELDEENGSIMPAMATTVPKVTAIPQPAEKETSAKNNVPDSTPISVLSTIYTDVKWSEKLGYVIVDNNSALIVGCSSDADKVSISSKIDGMTVVGIGDSAFENCVKLENVYIWADITSIGNNAFKECSSLKRISIPSSVKTIGTCAFENCSKLENAYIWGDSEIGDSAFKGCTSLTGISISSGIETIGVSAFAGCTSLEKVYIWGDTNISAYAFQGCTSIKEISIPSGVDLIDDYAFEGCTNLSKVHVWGSNTFISDKAFLNCPMLSKVPKSSNTIKPTTKSSTAKEISTLTPIPESTPLPEPRASISTNNRSSSEDTEDFLKMAGKTAHLESGKYIGGDDIPIGKYILVCKTDSYNSGIVWLAKDTDNLDEEYPSVLYEYISGNEERNIYVNIGDGYILNCSFPCDLIVANPISFENDTVRIEAGQYTIGDDLPAGKYILDCKTDAKNSGIVWIAKDTDNLDEEYPSVLYEYVGNNETKKYYMNAGNNYVLNCPFPCTLIVKNTLSFDGDSIIIEAGRYVFGDDLPSGKYTLTCNTTSQDSGIIWLAKDTDDLDEEYPSVLYEFVGDNDQDKFSINVRDGYILNCPFGCTLTKSQGVVFN